MTLSVLSLFSGIGGMDLGFEMAGGFKTAAMVEANPDRRADLARLFPGTRIYDDVVTCSAARLATDGLHGFDVICGGFPCQDISAANPGGRGLDGERSGLWFEYARLIAEFCPSWVVIENSPMLRRKGLGTILRFLDACGYDAFWDGIPARAVGAYHERDRLFIVAHDRSLYGRQGAARKDGTQAYYRVDGRAGCIATNIDGARLAFWQSFCRHLGEKLAAIKRDVDRARLRGAYQSGMGGTVYDVPATMDGPISRTERAIWKSRIHALGNSCVPHIVEAIGSSIISVDKIERIG